MSPTAIVDNQTRPAWPSSVVPDESVLIFDGVCKFCNNSVQLILRNERAPLLRFAAAQSATGAALLAHFGLKGIAGDSVVLIEQGQAYRKSDAALRLIPYLRWPWQCLRAGWLLPRFLRDWLYDGFAARRYTWFGKSDTCMIPTPATTQR